MASEPSYFAPDGDDHGSASSSRGDYTTTSSASPANADPPLIPERESMQPPRPPPDHRPPPPPPPPAPAPSSSSESESESESEPESEPESLPRPLRLLFAISGAALQLPGLALLSIVNDRAAVPPAYLPAYGAVAFLPWSLKPVYAYLSTAIVGGSCNRTARAKAEGAAGSSPRTRATSSSRRHHVLLSILLGLSGLSYVGTAFVPSGGVTSCFAWGFVRGVASSWPEFLLGVALIEAARREGGGGSGGSGGSGRSRSSATYEELASVYQSQAATSRNVGSLVVSGFTFVLFAGRRYYYHHRRGRLQDEGLGGAAVAALLFATAALSVLGSAVAMRFEVGSRFRGDGYESESDDEQPPGEEGSYRDEGAHFRGGASSSALEGSSNGAACCGVDGSSSAPPPPPGGGGRKRRLGLVGRVGGGRPYNEISTEEESGEGGDGDATHGSNPHLEMDVDVSNKRRPPPSSDSDASSSTNDEEATRSFTSAASTGTAAAAAATSPSAKRQQRRCCDVASIAFFQTLLVLAALRRPIASAATDAVWTGLLVLAGLGLASTLVASSRCYRPERDVERATAGSSAPGGGSIPPRRLALYLVLRHSVPIPGFLMYSFVYTIFASNPLFLQFLSVVDSAVSTLATKFYGRYLARTYNSGWSMIRLIAALSVVAALVSLLDVIVVHAANAAGRARDGHGGGGDGGEEADRGGGDSDTAHLRWLVFFVSIVTYFMGELGFMPSVVLATTNVVSSGDGPASNGQSGGGPFDEDQRRHGGGEDGMYAGADDCEVIAEGNFTSSHESGAAAAAAATTAAHQDEGRQPPPPLYDESMQYASFVSCIDFGAQVGDWISVPIIASLGITRENGWANLDRFIVICALLRIASVAFLWLLRPVSDHPQASQPIAMTRAKGVLS